MVSFLYNVTTQDPPKIQICSDLNRVPKGNGQKKNEKRMKPFVFIIQHDFFILNFLFSSFAHAKRPLYSFFFYILHLFFFFSHLRASERHRLCIPNVQNDEKISYYTYFSLVCLLSFPSEDTKFHWHFHRP